MRSDLLLCPGGPSAVATFVVKLAKLPSISTRSVLQDTLNHILTLRALKEKAENMTSGHLKAVVSNRA